MKQTVPILAFTVRANGRANALTNQIHLTEAFDPASAQRPLVGPFTALWDTGATNSVISQKVVQALGLQPSGRVLVRGVHGESETETFLVNVFLPNRVVIHGVKVSLGNIGSIDVLVGMDIIGHGDFAVSNAGGKTTFSFRVPSFEEIDFVRQHNASNVVLMKQRNKNARDIAQVANRKNGPRQ